MSQAFIRESDDQWLEDVGPSIKALSVFLSRQNNNLPVMERSRYKNPDGKDIHVMSNGLSYFKDADGKWKIA